MEETEACAKDSPLVLLKQGAEARVFESNFVGRRSVIKERFSKKYRHPTLDSKLTLRRLNAEARCVAKARKLGVCTPSLYAVDTVLNTLTFEYVEGPSLKEVLLEFGLKGVVEERLDDIASQVGDAIGKLHDGGLIHGDLTTSNMLLKSGTNQLMDRILAAYRKSSKQWSSTLNKLAQGINGRGSVAPVPQEMGEALMVDGCKPSHAPVGHGTRQVHVPWGGVIGSGRVTWLRGTALGRGVVTPHVPA
ncbi:hypothetical protein PIB30_058621 [Stylosanthes scabra]|uniref:non-specific serine/threonine protein kinase n=1 Tax=Stylosanthes scabra TaxID=79078 RepID=A0ABU6QJM2_9FABA|nr:hypothetical protein [Stylosanthes scabra]